MSDYGISQALPSLSREKHDEVLTYLQQFGVEREDDLKSVTIEDLMEKNLLKKLQARKLVEFWKSGKMNQGTGGVAQHNYGNVGRATTVQGTYNETHQGPEITNHGTVQGDVMAGGKKTTFKTDFGKTNVQAGTIFTGQGEVNQGVKEGERKKKDSDSKEPSISTFDTSFNEAKVKAETLFTGQGSVNIARTTASIAPKDFFFEDDKSFLWKKSHPKKVEKNSHIKKITDPDRYPIKIWGKNQALLINNWEFQNKAYNRAGASMDTNNLKQLLNDLGFVVHTRENLTETEVNKAVDEFTTSSEMAMASIILVFIGSHGNQKNNLDQFMDANNNMVSVPNLVDRFGSDRAPLLHEKPKIFLFQFCRVLDENAKDGAVQDDDIQSVGWFDDAAADGPNVAKAHLLSDMFLGYATAPGSAAFRHTSEGSWFVTTVRKIFEQKAHEEELDFMFKKVNDTVMRKKAGSEEKVQMCIYSSTLRKKVFFYPQ